MGTTTVLTLTLTGITADLASGGALKLARRGVRLVWMFLGAFLGAAFILHGTTLYAVIAVCCFYAATTVAALYSEQHASGAAAA